ncbi:AraC family transcriptional regulator [Mycolicibacillus parakoreensis]|nr:AraC family transcriptional regulator [Mycolicibacillus parakoreensis]
MAGLRMAGFRARGAAPVDLPVVPSPAVTLVLPFGGGSLVVEDAAGLPLRGSLVARLDPGGARMRGRNIQCVEVRLSPVIAPAVLGVSPAELHHPVVAAEEVWGDDMRRIQEQLGDAPSWQDRFALLEAVLARRRRRGPVVDPQVAWGWNRIVVSRGSVRVEDLAAELGWSRKRLWTRFRSQIGLAPKRAAKLVRFGHAAHRLAAGESAAQVAAACGYADQSHFHREVLAFTAMTPTTLAGGPGLAVNDIAYAGRGTSGTFVQDPHP